MVQNMLRTLKAISRYERRRFCSNNLHQRLSPTVDILSYTECTLSVKQKIEGYWRDKINSYKCIANNDMKDKFYVLSMFPYPSGALHMGHVRVYTISDVLARFYRLKGKNVIHPMGWDAFGLPAENAAIERKIDPAVWTSENIKTMHYQLKKLNYSFDWEREFATCDADYYKWTQELFLKLFDKGLAYQKKAYVNWDPIDQTVLAEEQVDLNQRSWRSGAIVEKKLLNQWFIKTTAFAKSLREGLDDPNLKEWKDIIKLQKHWIGDCNGINIDFKLISEIPDFPEIINLWTDMPEFIEYAKFVAISPESILHRKEHTYDIDVGIKGLNAKIINPFSGEELPIFITDKVVYPPWRDTRLGIPSASMDDLNFSELVGIPFTRHSIRNYEQQQQKISEIIQKAREWRIGGYPVSSRLQDWLISRQRYWGTPIPIIHCINCGIQPVPRDQLPVTLPKIIHSSSNKGFSIHDAKDWLQTECPKCGEKATRETDTMDTFVDSSWYFLRFIDPKNTKEMFAIEKVKEAFPVDLYIGGKEHAVLHLYYARFMSHFLHSEGLIPCREPFRQLLVQGVIMGKTYKTKNTGQYVAENELIKEGDQYKTKSGELVFMNWEKMSKSKRNGVEPISLLYKYGIDTTRLLILADVAPTSTRNWSENTIPGIKNWQNRIWSTIKQFKIERDNMSLEQLQSEPTNPNYVKHNAYMFDSRNYFLKNVTYNMVKSQQLSIAISRMQGLTNSLRKVNIECLRKSREYERALAVQIIMLAPFAPHFASELWAIFCSVKHHLIDNNEVSLDKDVLEQKWPDIDMDYKLILNVYMNKRQFLKLKFPRYILDKMTAEMALEDVILHPHYKKISDDKNIVDINLESEKGCDASLYITMEKQKEDIRNTVITD
ncbi:probable leucine--tRNA ligase, mitochondrial isoform X1 [Cataglyphis hispanica]|uniref:probable leucine--tRNA ligase, mitochondrial isoform X1 n=2 Tax=Cataglyphis hispanica TaxID=1086592 RepID=UPI00217F4B99|nr:probable leucine--tRNA ligase, mitochondrial isoform X1 [Cataglyphis hispanica]